MARIFEYCQTIPFLSTLSLLSPQKICAMGSQDGIYHPSNRPRYHFLLKSLLVSEWLSRRNEIWDVLWCGPADYRKFAAAEGEEASQDIHKMGRVYSIRTGASTVIVVNSPPTAKEVSTLPPSCLFYSGFIALNITPGDGRPGSSKIKNYCLNLLLFLKFYINKNKISL